VAGSALTQHSKLTTQRPTRVCLPKWVALRPVFLIGGKTKSASAFIAEISSIESKGRANTVELGHVKAKRAVKLKEVSGKAGVMGVPDYFFGRRKSRKLAFYPIRKWDELQS
jgi:hypothetical protein